MDHHTREMSAHYACILTVGDELLNGDVLNTNASWLGEILLSVGIPCRTMITVMDRQPEIVRTLELCWKHHDLIIVTGGLGPTRDDVTKPALLEFFNDVLIRDESVLTHVTEYFQKRGRPVSEENMGQADIPSRSRVLFNELGTAPGIFIPHEGKYLAAMPGVPYELRHITEKQLLPELERIWEKSERRVQQQYFRATGIGESILSDLLLVQSGIKIPKSTDLAFLPHPRGVDMRITRINGEEDHTFDEFVEHIRKSAHEFIFTEQYGTSLAGAVVELLSERDMTLTVAESSTGGLLADEITNTPGSSTCFKGGIVAYDNEIKCRVLGVRAVDLSTYGAVSGSVALTMAENAGKKMESDIAVSTTGIAGPGGGSDDKPVGTVWIGFWTRTGTHFACRYQFTTIRRVNKERSCAAALDMIRRHLLNIPGLPHKPEVVFP